MFLRSGAENVGNLHPASGCCVGYEGTMTSPRHRFRAHDRRALEAGEAQQVFHRAREPGGLHIVGVRPESLVSPLNVAGILFRRSPPAQLGCVRVRDAGGSQGFLQVGSIEVRVAPRCGKGAHIDKMCHAFPFQQPEEFLERSGRMSYGKKPSGDHAPRSCLPLPSAFPMEA